MGAKGSDRICPSIRAVLLAGTMAGQNQSLENDKLAVFPDGHNHLIHSRLMGPLPQGSEKLLWRNQ
jgi:hypothetical protein